MTTLKKYSYWLQSGKYTAIQKIVTLSIGILSFMLLTRILGPGSFGVWGLFLIISSITETARTALIKNAYIRFLHQSESDIEANLQTAVFVLSLILSIFISFFFYFLSNTVSYLLNAPDLSVMLKWYSLTVIIYTLFSHSEIILSSKMDFRGICWMYCFRQLFLLLPILYCYFFAILITPIVLSIFYLSSILVGTLSALFFCRPFFKCVFADFSQWIRRIWNFGKYVLGNNISSLLFRSTDNFITSKFYGTIIAGQYNACLRIGNLIDLPSQVMGDILFPKVAQVDSSDKAQIKNMYEKAVGASLVFSIPALLFLLLFPGLILRILAGPQFIFATEVLRITAIFGFILPFLKQFGTMMDATGTPKLNFIVMFVAFCLNIISNLICVYFWGWIGAAFGTLFTYCIVFIITQVIMYVKFGVEIQKIIRNTFGFYTEFICYTSAMFSGKIFKK